ISAFQFLFAAHSTGSCRASHSWLSRRTVSPLRTAGVMSLSRRRCTLLGLRRYGLAFFAGAGAVVFFLGVSPPLLLSSVKASLALKGKRRTDCSPVVLRVTSTRRLLARRTVSRFFRIFCFSAGVRSASASISCLTSSEVIFFS